MKTPQQILDGLAEYARSHPAENRVPTPALSVLPFPLSSIMQKSGAPRRHVEFDALAQNKWPDWQHNFELARSKLNGRGGMVALVGERSTGKTQMAVELLRIAALARRSIRLETACGFFRAIKATYSAKAINTEEEVVRSFREYGFLVLDEIGKTGATDWESAELFELLNLRYGDMKDTLLISNATQPDFASIIGPSLVRRLNETGGIILCNW